MGKEIERLESKIYEFKEAKMKSPTWVKLHPHVYRSLRLELPPSLVSGIEEPLPIMGMEVREDATKEKTFMEVGAD
jgi:hypothetical protein